MELLRFYFVFPFLFEVVTSQPSSNPTLLPTLEEQRSTNSSNTAINEITLTAEMDVSCPDGSSSCDFYLTCTVTNPTMFSVEGDVSSPPGSYFASYGDKGFFIDDGTGGIFIQTGETALKLKVGDRVKVLNGKTACLYGTLVLSDVEIWEGSNDMDGDIVFSPRQVGQLAKKPPIAGDPDVVPNYCDCFMPFSATTGRTITVRGKAVGDLEDDGIYGYKLFLDDGNGVTQVFIDASADIPVDEIRDTLLRKGKDLYVTGLVAHFAGVGYELLPRTISDFVDAENSDSKNIFQRRMI